jgi:hypothetical protein
MVLVSLLDVCSLTFPLSLFHPTAGCRTVESADVIILFRLDVCAVCAMSCNMHIIHFIDYVYFYAAFCAVERTELSGWPLRRQVSEGSICPAPRNEFIGSPAEASSRRCLKAAFGGRQGVKRTRTRRAPFAFPCLPSSAWHRLVDTIEFLLILAFDHHG